LPVRPSKPTAEGLGPQSEIVGHASQRATLGAVAARDALHHAYLFEGPARVGKRTIANWLAMAANCETGAVDPCGRCSSCVQIAKGTHPDILLLEPRSDRATPIIGVDQVREVVRQAGFRRFAARRRFVLVDPAEAMTAGASNALLKTLEEPPPGTGFILIATHASALLPTIVSRCQRVRFGAVAPEAIRSWLRTRGVEASESAITLAQGCPGEAWRLTTTDRIATREAFRGEVLQALHGTMAQRFAFGEKICRGARPAVRERITTLLDVLADGLRDAVVTGSRSDRPLLDGDTETAARWASALWPGGIRRSQEALLAARDQLEVNVSARTVVDALLHTVAMELGTGSRRA
jgi:DNA polymerase III subunit delta'